MDLSANRAPQNHVFFGVCVCVLSFTQCLHYVSIKTATIMDIQLFFRQTQMSDQVGHTFQLPLQPTKYPIIYQR